MTFIVERSKNVDFYKNIDDIDKVHLYVNALNDKKSIIIMSSISGLIHVFPIEFGFIIVSQMKGTKKQCAYTVELTNDPSLFKVIIERETNHERSLDDTELERVLSELEKMEKIEVGVSFGCLLTAESK